MAKQPPRPPDGGKIKDQRAKFRRLTRQTQRDEEAERAFIEGKKAMLESDPNLTEDEKRSALQELEGKLGNSRR